MTPNMRGGLTLAAAVVLVDQLVKWLMIVPLRLREVGNIHLLPVFDFTYVENRGVSFGMLTADTHVGRWALVAMTAAISAGVLWWMRKEERRADVMALGAVLGGAVGNIIDRARLGYVIDYADLHFGAFRPFMVFNIADAAITLGVVTLLVRSLVVQDRKDTLPNA